MSDGWSREELLASVEAYLEMQRKHRAGERFVKKRYYEDLASRFDRTDKSFEYRMQNISYVMTLLGRTWPPPSGKLSPVLLTTRGLKEMTIAALQRGCQS